MKALIGVFVAVAFSAGAALLATIGSAAFAQTAQLISAVPTAWRIENYVPDNVVVWFTGSPCASGQVLLPGTAVKADRDRLFATIATGKAANKKVFIVFTQTGGSCVLNSFGLQEE